MGLRLILFDLLISIFSNYKLCYTSACLSVITCGISPIVSVASTILNPMDCVSLCLAVVGLDSVYRVESVESFL